MQGEADNRQCHQAGDVFHTFLIFRGKMREVNDETPENLPHSLSGGGFPSQCPGFFRRSLIKPGLDKVMKVACVYLAVIHFVTAGIGLVLVLHPPA